MTSPIVVGAFAPMVLLCMALTTGCTQQASDHAAGGCTHQDSPPDPPAKQRHPSANGHIAVTDNSRKHSQAPRKIAHQHHQRNNAVSHKGLRSGTTLSKPGPGGNISSKSRTAAAGGAMQPSSTWSSSDETPADPYQSKKFPIEFHVDLADDYEADYWHDVKRGVYTAGEEIEFKGVKFTVEEFIFLNFNVIIHRTSVLRFCQYHITPNVITLFFE